MRAAKTSDPLEARVSDVLTDFTDWLRVFGEKSWDFQSFFAGPVGGRAKALYYRHRLVGTAAVAPMIFCEAFLPSARRLFHHPMRFPIADAHYAMGFAFLYQATGDVSQLENSIHFLTELEKSRCPEFKEYCWGYPFDWVWRGGTIKRETPLITTTPYVYEAFLQAFELQPRNEWKLILQSIARHAAADIQDFRTSETASSCSYTPSDEGGVINAAAYRAFLLTSASKVFGNEDYWRIAERNLNFVLENQNSDGSWFYAIDGVRDCVECINLCLLLRDRFPQLEATLEKVVTHILEAWTKPDGSFRSRKLHLGWDNVPMHRWGQAQMFRSLAFYLCESTEAAKEQGRKCEGGSQKTRNAQDGQIVGTTMAKSEAFCQQP